MYSIREPIDRYYLKNNTYLYGYCIISIYMYLQTVILVNCIPVIILESFYSFVNIKSQ